MIMTKQLALEAYSLVDRLDTLSWQLARNQDYQAFERVGHILNKARSRYYRRYHAFKSQGSSSISP